MSSRLRRNWLPGLLLLAIAVILGVNLSVDAWTKEPPNYTEIEPGLWLGGHVKEPPKQTSAVLNLCEIKDPYNVEHHLWESIPDKSPPPSLDWLNSQVEWIERERAEGRTVYVHCRNGISRSGMVMVAYLMKRERWTRDQALEQIRTKRPIRPNPAFMELLKEWEKRIQS